MSLRLAWIERAIGRSSTMRDDYFIVTKDADFSDLCVLLGFPPKVIWIRRGNCSARAVQDLLRRHHKDIEALETDAVNGVLTLFETFETLLTEGELICV